MTFYITAVIFVYGIPSHSDEYYYTDALDVSNEGPPRVFQSLGEASAFLREKQIEENKWYTVSPDITMSVAVNPLSEFTKPHYLEPSR
jgi:hypothetical protein